MGSRNVDTALLFISPPHLAASSGWPSNVFRRIGRGSYFNNWYEDLAHPSTNFHGGGGQKVWHLASFSTSLNFELPTFENAAIYPNCETNFLCRHEWSQGYSHTKFGEVGSTHPWEPLGRNAPPQKKLQGENMLNRQ